MLRAETAADVRRVGPERLEEAIFFNVADLLNSDADVVFYDTTTCRFSVDEEDDENGLRRFGHAKEGGWSAQWRWR